MAHNVWEWEGNMAIRDKVVLITGATGALGQAVSRTFAEAGAWLALTARSEERLDELAAALGLPADRLLTHPADVTDAASVDELVKQTVARLGRVDALLHVAGGWRGGKTVSETGVGDLDFMLTLNLKSAFLVCRAVIPYMAAQEWGRIVAVGSRSAVRPTRRSGAYAASKAGLIALIETIATEIKDKGITANAVLPSTIDTPANRQAMPQADFSKWVPAEQIAATMLYLCSDEAAAVNGARIPVYGRA
jgi:NAD(P)-dependent dehydrogenase (short-subunit alcohol dehydrogenase family)